MSRFWKILVLSIVIAALSLVAGCGSSATKDAGNLQGPEWQLLGSSINATNFASVGITAKFDGTTVSGFSGVNQYTGPYTSKPDGSFKAGPLAATLMAGSDQLMAAEGAYRKLLEGCDSYQVADGKLTLSTGGNVTLVYEPATKAELPGTKWAVVNYNNGKQAVTSPALGSTLTVEFSADGKISGNGGVNNFNGGYESDATTVKIGPLAATQMAGPPELMTQETAYLAALQNSKKWEIVRGKLEMRDLAGALQIVGVKP